MKFHLVVVLVAVIAIAGCGSEDKKASSAADDGNAAANSEAKDTGGKKPVANQEPEGKKSAKEGEDGLLEGETSINPSSIFADDDGGIN